MLVDSPSTLSQREPTLIITTIVAVLQIVLAVIAGSTDVVSGTAAAITAVVNTVFILAGGVAIRSQVTPAATAPQTDAH